MLGAMSKRMVERIEDEVKDLGKVTRTDGQAASAMLVSGIQSQIAVGEVSFIYAESVEDDD
jgi:flagellar motor switch protein FliG